MSKRVYISGAVSSIGWAAAKKLFDKAKNAINSVEGYEAVSPLDHDEEDKTKTWEWYMRKDIKILMDCDYIFMLPNWRQSDGAILEKYIADEVGIKELTL